MADANFSGSLGVTSGLLLGTGANRILVTSDGLNVNVTAAPSVLADREFSGSVEARECLVLGVGGYKLEVASSTSQIAVRTSSEVPDVSYSGTVGIRGDLTIGGGADKITLSSSAGNLLVNGSVYAGAFNIFVDSAAGNDTTGTGSSTLPYATITKAFAVATAGQGIGLKRGSIFRETTTLATNRVTLGAYGSGADPIVSGGVLVSSWTQQGSDTTGTQIAFDDFSGATGGNLSAHTANTGQAWAKNTETGDSIITATNKARGGTAKTRYDLNATPSTVECDVECDFTFVTLAATGAIVARSIGNTTRYQAAYSTGSTWWAIDDSGSTVANSAVFPITLNQTYHVLFRIRNAYKAIIVDGVEVTRTTSNIQNLNGKTGLQWSANGSSSDANGIQMDNFKLSEPGAPIVTDTWAATLASLPGTPPIVTFTKAGATTLLVAGSGASSLTAGQYYYTGGSLYVNIGAGVDPGTGVVEVASVALPMTVSGQSFTARGVEFRFGSNGMLSLNNNNGLTIDQCSFRYCTYTSNSGTLRIQSGSTAAALPNKVTRCVFQYLANDAVWVHDTANVEISYSTFANIGELVGDVQSDGIQVENTFGTAPNSDNTWIHHNTLTMGSISPKGGILVNTDSSISSASSTAIVEYNTCVGGNYGIAVHSSNIIVRYNVCSGQVSTYGGNIHIDTAYVLTGIQILWNVLYASGRDGIVIQDSANRRQVVIANNTIVDSTRAQMYLGSPIDGTIENNILWNTVTPPTLRTLYILSITGGQTLTVDYNLYQAAFTGYLRFGGTAYDTLALWRAAVTQDVHTISSDPLFVNAAARNYALTSGSPAKGTGVAIPGIGQTTPINIGAL